MAISTKKVPAEVVHESEAQRQHLRVQIPARVKVEGWSYPVADLSAGGMKIRDMDKIFQDGRSLDHGCGAAERAPGPQLALSVPVILQSGLRGAH